MVPCGDPTGCGARPWGRPPTYVVFMAGAAYATLEGSAAVLVRPSIAAAIQAGVR
eukprot:CAMPEP_0168471956 /NCGR_PEP_ID=MMETSP0228-20121227/59554_1 /TAXON_ID=133427 /ORGANISM="Protoceratium reticulatum, Strain CCCM 535 (=CCMP 1889)" /LENGTH=54 /DNA_ID=CAMNT_0008487891 /DNA_START=195 /DNA_END=355 /DNA_ORIENTATION=-